MTGAQADHLVGALLIALALTTLAWGLACHRADERARVTRARARVLAEVPHVEQERAA